MKGFYKSEYSILLISTFSTLQDLHLHIYLKLSIQNLCKKFNWCTFRWKCAKMVSKIWRKWTFPQEHKLCCNEFNVLGEIHEQPFVHLESSHIQKSFELPSFLGRIYFSKLWFESLFRTIIQVLFFRVLSAQFQFPSCRASSLYQNLPNKSEWNPPCREHLVEGTNVQMPELPRTPRPSRSVWSLERQFRSVKCLTKLHLRWGMRSRGSPRTSFHVV